MSCKIKIELDRPHDKPIHPGEELTGEVLVKTTGPVGRSKLVVTLGWRANKTFLVPPEQQVLFEGDWEGNELYTYRFCFTVPNGPASYTGKWVDVQWAIRAYAKTPLAFEPYHRLPLTMEGSTDGPYDHGPAFELNDDTEDPPNWLLALNLLLFIPFGLLPRLTWFIRFILFLTLMASIIWFTNDRTLALCFFLCPMLFVIGSSLYSMFITLRRAVALYRRKASRKRLGEVEVEITEQPRAGGMVDVLIQIQPERDTPLDKVLLTLRFCEKRARHSSNDVFNGDIDFDWSTSFRDQLDDLPPMPLVLPETREEQYATRVLWQTSHAIEVDDTIEAGEPTIYTHSFTLPADAPATFVAPDVAALWELEVCFDIPRYPDWTEVYPVAVRPRPV